LEIIVQFEYVCIDRTVLKAACDNDCRLICNFSNVVLNETHPSDKHGTGILASVQYRIE